MCNYNEKKVFLICIDRKTQAKLIYEKIRNVRKQLMLANQKAAHVARGNFRTENSTHMKTAGRKYNIFWYIYFTSKIIEIFNDNK